MNIFTKKLPRRQLLKISATSVAMPIILTLLPKQARATGSWSPTQSQFQGIDWGEQPAPNHFIFPGSYEDRMSKQEMEMVYSNNPIIQRTIKQKRIHNKKLKRLRFYNN